MSIATIPRLALLLLVWAFVAAADVKPRLIITTDIGGDPDDQQSLVRLLLYANEFDIEGLIASAAGTPGELGQSIVRPDLIRQQIDAYAQVRGSLVRHASAFPTADALRAVVKSGNPQRGVNAIGAGKDTEGSNWIISVVDRSDTRPVDIAIWGGQTDLGQALWKIKNTRTASAYQQFVSRIRVHDIADQDGIYTWLRGMFPEVWYILAKSQDGVGCNSVFRGMFKDGDTSTVTKSWIDTNIVNGHGALGALYPRDGLWTCGNGINGIKEGDTPSWFYFLRHGLNDPAEPTWGGWGARFQREGTVWRDAQDTVNGSTSRTATVWRWRPAYQADFQARLDWCVRDFAAANHAPIAVLNGQAGREVVRLNVTAGQSVTLNAAGSSDPDGHALTYRWFQYREPGTHAGAITLAGATSSQASFTAPSVTSFATIHVVVEVKDNGSPALTSFRRVVLQVDPVVNQPTTPLIDDTFSDGVIDPRWQPIGDLPLAERNGRIEITTTSSSTWRGGGLFLRDPVEIGSGLIYRVRLGVPDISSNQFAEITLTPAWVFDAEGQAQEYLRAAIRGSTLTLTTRRSGITTTLWSVGGISAGQVMTLELTMTAGRVSLTMDGVVRFDGSHALSWTHVHPGFRAANRDDAKGGLAWFDDVAIRRPATTPGFAGAVINFQPSGAVTPAGMVADSGAVFAARNGLSYGWNVANSETRERNSSAAPDQAHDTLNHLQKTSSLRWELALPSGWYEVRIVRGDPAFTDQVNHLLVEGVTMADPDGADRFDDDTVTVQVSDGRLTVAPASNAVNAKVCFIEVVAVPVGGG
ncbi:MAG: DUF1593 domain-containing protein [Planctomycetes bacterium]|nr:DUF1593 domain-containing protein [Planctomycetota bacterium]